MCDGKNPECALCHGKGEISVLRCPRALVTDAMSFILPYYYQYRKSGGVAWPDGRGRLFQPIKLVTAFDILDIHYDLHFKEK